MDVWKYESLNYLICMMVKKAKRQIVKNCKRGKANKWKSQMWKVKKSENLNVWESESMEVWKSKSQKVKGKYWKCVELKKCIKAISLIVEKVWMSGCLKILKPKIEKVM